MEAMEKAGLVFGEPLKKQERIDIQEDPSADPGAVPAKKKVAAA